MCIPKNTLGASLKHLLSYISKGHPKDKSRNGALS
jgi:hypothetical protein